MCGTDKKKGRPFPRFDSEAAAEEFVATADLSEYDFSGFRPERFGVEPKSAQLHLRVPQAPLDALKRKSRHRGLPYTRYVRELIERDLARPEEPAPR